MKHYGIDSQYLLAAESAATLPSWDTIYKRSFIYAEDENRMYYGTNTGWAAWGTSGTSGSSGSSGIAGTSGSSGVSGSSGTSGVSGTSGSSGTSPTATSGTSGLSGSSGTSGSGTSGSSGVSGMTGNVDNIRFARDVSNANWVNIQALSNQSTPDASNIVRVSIPDGNSSVVRSRSAAYLSGNFSIRLADAGGYWGYTSITNSTYEAYIYAIWDSTGIVFAMCSVSGITNVPTTTTVADANYFLLENASTYTRNAAHFCKCVGKLSFEYYTTDTPDYTIDSDSFRIITDGDYHVESYSLNNKFKFAKYIQAYNSTTTNIGNTTPAAITWGGEDFKSSDLFTHSTGTNPSRITVLKRGIYRVFANICLDNQGSGIVLIRIRVDGTTYDTRASAYIMCSSTTYDYNSNSIDMYMQLSANSYIEIMGNGVLGSSTKNTTTSTTYIVVELVEYN